MKYILPFASLADQRSLCVWTNVSIYTLESYREPARDENFDLFTRKDTSKYSLYDYCFVHLHLNAIGSFKVHATSLKLEIRLHAHQDSTNARSGTEVNFYSGGSRGGRNRRPPKIGSNMLFIIQFL